MAASSAANPRLVWGACALAFLAALFLYTRANTIPYYYHSDEPSKATQVTAERGLNFKHPLLLMNATRLSAHVLGRDDDRQRAVMTGRYVSAVFAALSVAALVALARRQYGWGAAACVGGIVLLSHGLFTFAHFMKEDTALLLGLVLTLWACVAFLERRTLGWLALLGAACALAVSGKYAGIFAPIVVIPLLVWVLGEGPAPGRTRGLLVFAAALLVTVAVVNITSILEWKSFLRGLGYETEHASSGGGKPFQAFFSLTYVHGLLSQSTWPVRILATGTFAWVLLTWRERRLDEKVVALFPALFLAMLWISPIKAIRYLLPVVIGAHYLAGVGLALLVERFTMPGRRRAALLSVALGAVLVPQVLEIRTHWGEFASDSRLTLYEWVQENVEPGSHLLQDRYAGLPDAEWGYLTEQNAPIPGLTLETLHFATEFGSLPEMRAAGIDYVVVCGRAFERYFSEDKQFGSDEAREQFMQHKRGYEALFREGELVFEAGGPKVAGAPVNPVVRVYRLGPAKGRSREDA